MKNLQRWANAAVFAAGLFTIPQAHGEVVRIPFTRINDSYFVTVDVDGYRDKCLIDTGADIVLAPATWPLDGFTPTGLAHMVGANNIKFSQPEGYFQRIYVGGMAVDKVNAVLGKPEAECLLGQSFLSRFSAVMLDYAHNALVLVRP